MSNGIGMKQRAANYTARHGQGDLNAGTTGGGKGSGSQSGNTGTAGGRTIDTFTTQVYAIVDGELTEAYGFADVPDMSLTVICAAVDGGWTAPVPVSEARLFRNLNKEAIQALLETERNRK